MTKTRLSALALVATVLVGNELASEMEICWQFLEVDEVRR